MRSPYLPTTGGKPKYETYACCAHCDKKVQLSDHGLGPGAYTLPIGWMELQASQIVASETGITHLDGEPAAFVERYENLYCDECSPRIRITVGDAVVDMGA